jgi:hypothetical protein
MDSDDKKPHHNQMNNKCPFLYRTSGVLVSVLVLDAVDHRLKP